jgi:glycosyltransferase involved in cell wall biosynthesis
MDIEGWINAIKKVMQEDTRREMVRKGIERAKSFSWERAARETIRVYKII